MSVGYCRIGAFLYLIRQQGVCVCVCTGFLLGMLLAASQVERQAVPGAFPSGDSSISKSCLPVLFCATTLPLGHI